MGLAERVLARAANRGRSVDPVTMEEFGYLLGQGRGTTMRTKAGVTVGPKRALGLSAWYRGVSYLTNQIAGLPAHTFRTLPGDIRQQRADPLWRTNPDGETPWYGTVEHWLMSLLHRGNAYNFKKRDQRGVVSGLRSLHPDRVIPGQASDGTKMFVVDNNRERPFTSREILHIPGLGDDGICGLNPIQYHAESLGLVVASEEYAARTFGQGSHLRAYITLPQTLSTTESDALREQWEAFHSGMANAASFGVLGNGADYKTVSLSPAESQLLEARQFGVTEVARILGVTPHKLYDLTHATYSNIEHQAIESVTDSIQPWVQRIEAYVNYDQDLLPGVNPSKNFLEFQLEGLLRGDTATRYDAYSKAIGGPWMTVNEGRRRENYSPVDGGDTLNQAPNTAGPQPDPGPELPPDDGGDDE